MTRSRMVKLPLPQGADARNRAWRTLAQGLLLDVGVAVALLLAVALADVQWTRAYWIALGASLGRTVAQTGVAYVMRHLKPPPTA